MVSRSQSSAKPRLCTKNVSTKKRYKIGLWLLSEEEVHRLIEGRTVRASWRHE